LLSSTGTLPSNCLSLPVLRVQTKIAPHLIDQRSGERFAL
jgi:hypothetical protein